jgi:hypothetical protein
VTYNHANHKGSCNQSNCRPRQYAVTARCQILLKARNLPGKLGCQIFHLFSRGGYLIAQLARFGHHRSELFDACIEGRNGGNRIMQCNNPGSPASSAPALPPATAPRITPFRRSRTPRSLTLSGISANDGRNAWMKSCAALVSSEKLSV